MDKLRCPYCGAPVTDDTKYLGISNYSNTPQYQCSVCGATFYENGVLGWNGDLSHLTEDFEKKLSNEKTKAMTSFIAEPDIKTAKYLSTILNLCDRYFGEE